MRFEGGRLLRVVGGDLKEKKLVMAWSMCSGGRLWGRHCVGPGGAEAVLAGGRVWGGGAGRGGGGPSREGWCEGGVAKCVVGGT